MRTGKETLANDVFRQFRDYVGGGGPSITEIVSDIQDIAASFQKLDTISDWSHEGMFLYRWHVMDAAFPPLWSSGSLPTGSTLTQ